MACAPEDEIDPAQTFLRFETAAYQIEGRYRSNKEHGRRKNFLLGIVPTGWVA
jgi:hypothetical protein